MGDLGFAVVGCGGFGKRRIASLRKIGAKIACLVDIDEKKSQNSLETLELNFVQIIAKP